MDISNAVQHLLELLQDRGEDTKAIQTAITEMAGDYTPLKQSIYDHWKTDKTTVVFALSKLFFSNYIKNYIKDTEINLFELYERPRVILITDETPSPSLLSTFQQRDKQHQAAVPPVERPILQLFTLKELQYNPTHHQLVPKHVWIPETTVKEILEKYQVKTKSHLPHILRTDKIAKWLGLRVGDVVQITRPNENSGIYHYYRCCV
jgi:DNA-directed RNA polymerase subunit H (RpoH/RPB5)